MSDYLNDSPIENFDDDRYGIGPFAKTLAKSFLSIKNPIGTTVALHGPWGAGKSSVVNLIKSELNAANDQNLIISDFKSWWFRGEEALALAFLQHLNALLKDELGKKVEKLVPSMARTLLQAGPIVGPVLATATGNPLAGLFGLSAIASRQIPKGQSVEQAYAKLSKVLDEQHKRFLIVIDDIDRLMPHESLAIFRIVKSVGRLPKVMYLLVFDRELADKAVADLYPSEGPHFLEKIIQAGFELPQPSQTDLNSAVLSAVEEVCGQTRGEQVRNIMNAFYDAVAPYITTPRHVARFRNAISVTWPAISNEISVADFIVLEVLRLYEPDLFRHIRAHKANLCGIRQQGDPDSRDESRFTPYLNGVREENHEAARLAIMRLFPRMEEIGYAGDFISAWDAERRVCVEKHFDTYFRLALSEETLSTQAINDIIQRASEVEYVQSAARRAAATERKGGKTGVPVLLDELTTHARRVAKEDVTPLLSALFQVHDDIDLKADAERGFYGMANTSLRFHWLMRRLMADRFSLAERTQAYLTAIQNAALGWLVDFVSSARSDYQEREGRIQREENLLVTEDALETLTQSALSAIRAAAEEGTLLRHQDLPFILYRWRDFSGDSAEVRAWTSSQLGDDAAVVIFARALTGESWSFGMGGFGGLGDRVSMPQTRAQIDGADEILDLQEFRIALERIQREQNLDSASLADVQTFVQAWEQRGQDSARND